MKALKESLLGSWRTSLIGLATMFFAFVVFSPETFAGHPTLIAIAKFAASGGLGALGFASRDSGR